MADGLAPILLCKSVGATHWVARRLEVLLKQ